MGFRRHSESREDRPILDFRFPRGPVPAGTPPRRRHLLLLGLGFLGLAFYGSLVPWHLQEVRFEEAWQDFWRLPAWRDPDFSNRSDWGTNILLYIPLSFCWLGCWCLDRESRLGKLLGTGCVAGLCLISSLLVEFLQHWVEGRVPSPNDVYAQAVGTLLGMLAWFGFGQPLIDWWRLQTSQNQRQRLLSAVLSLYVLGFLAYSLFPLDLIRHPGELYQKYKAGRIQLLPEWNTGISQAAIWGFTSDVLAYFPIGIWAALIWSDERHPRTWIRSLLIGGGVALGIEVAQLFVMSRFTEWTDVLAALVGVALGSGGVCYLASHDRAAPVAHDHKLYRQLAWGSAALLYTGFLIGYFCWPLEVDHNPERIRNAWSRFFEMPMTALFWSSEYNAATQLFRKLTLWSVLGMLVSQPVLGMRLPRALAWGGLVLGWVYCTVSGMGVELFQLLLPNHTPNGTDAGLYSLGAALGIGCAVWWKQHATPVPTAHSALGNSGRVVSSAGSAGRSRR